MLIGGRKDETHKEACLTVSAIQKRQVIDKHSSHHARNEQKELIIKKKKLGLIRRLIVFGIVAGAFSFFLISVLIGQANEIASKQSEKAKVEKQLAALKNKEKVLKDDIKKLNDDEYLAKLARKDYFLSSENEIIFSIPEKQ